MTDLDIVSKREISSVKRVLHKCTFDEQLRCIASQMEGFVYNDKEHIILAVIDYSNNIVCPVVWDSTLRKHVPEDNDRIIVQRIKSRANILRDEVKLRIKTLNLSSVPLLYVIRDCYEQVKNIKKMFICSKRFESEWKIIDDAFNPYSLPSLQAAIDKINYMLNTI
jgi:hypothetical protein